MSVAGERRKGVVMGSGKVSMTGSGGRRNRSLTVSGAAKNGPIPKAAANPRHMQGYAIGR